jgi:hypothetical protein
MQPVRTARKGCEVTPTPDQDHRAPGVPVRSCGTPTPAAAAEFRDGNGPGSFVNHRSVLHHRLESRCEWQRGGECGRLVALRPGIRRRHGTRRTECPSAHSGIALAARASLAQPTRSIKPASRPDRLTEGVMNLRLVKTALFKNTSAILRLRPLAAATLIASMTIATGVFAQGTSASKVIHQQYRVLVLPVDGGTDSLR